MTRKPDRDPIMIPPEFGMAVGKLASGAAAKLETEKFPFSSFPMSCVVSIYEPPGLSVIHIAGYSGEDPISDDGAWALLAPSGIERLATFVADGKATVEFAREDSRFRDALTDQYWAPGESGNKGEHHDT